MAITLLDKGNLADDPNLIKRIEIAVISTAISVKNEDAAAENHSARAKLADAVLEDPVLYSRRMIKAVLASASLDSSEITDEAITSSLSTIWNAYALKEA